MTNKKFAHISNYLKIFKAVPQKKPRVPPPQQNKKSRADDSCLFQSLAETVTTLRFSSFTIKSVSGLKQKKLTPPRNSVYSD